MVAGFIAKEKYTFPVLLTEGTDTIAKYSIGAYPTLVAVDKEGTVAVAPPAPRLLSPAPVAVFDHFPRETTLVWAAVPGASSYFVETDYYSGEHWYSEQHSTPVAFHVADPVYSFRFVGAQPGRWRVWAVDAAGRPGPKSD